MTSRTPLRSCEDVDESVLNYAEVKALCIGDPRIKEKMELDIDVNKLKLLEASYKNQQFALQDKLRKGFPTAIAETEKKIALLKQDTATAETTKEAEFKMTLMGKTYGLDKESKPQKKEAAEALLAMAQTLGHNEGTVGEYRGFKMSFYLSDFGKVYLNLQGATTHNVEMGESAEGNLTRLNNTIDGISKRLESAQAKLANIHEQIKTAEEELTKPFARADELKEKSARLAELNIALTMPEKQEPTVENTPTPDNENTEQVKDIPVVEQPFDNAANFRGIPTNVGPVSEQEIRDLKLVEGNPNIHLHPRKDGQQYRGEVVLVDTERGFCLQQIGKRTLFCHDLKDLERTPAKGETIKLAYPREDGHKAAVIHQEAQSRTQARVYA